MKIDQIKKAPVLDPTHPDYSFYRARYSRIGKNVLRIMGLGIAIGTFNLAAIEAGHIEKADSNAYKAGEANVAPAHVVGQERVIVGKNGNSVSEIIAYVDPNLSQTSSAFAEVESKVASELGPDPDVNFVTPGQELEIPVVTNGDPTNK